MQKKVFLTSRKTCSIRGAMHESVLFSMELKDQTKFLQHLESIIQWTRIFGTGVVELVCDAFHAHSTPIPHPFRLDLSSSIIP
jgi:hypothetical protein